MQDQTIIDEKKYDVWYSSVLFHLKTSFTKPDNEYANRFAGPPPLPSFTNDGIPTVQLDLQFELKSDFPDNLSNLYIIISDIHDRFCN